MTRVSLAALATLALLGAAACQDAITSPQGSIDSSLRLRVSNPPPPPADTGASGSFLGTTLRAEPSGKLLQPRFSIQQGFGPMSSPSHGRQTRARRPKLPASRICRDSPPPAQFPPTAASWPW